jgi:hypothetical protein
LELEKLNKINNTDYSLIMKIKEIFEKERQCLNESVNLYSYSEDFIGDLSEILV